MTRLLYTLLLLTMAVSTRAKPPTNHTKTIVPPQGCPPPTHYTCSTCNPKLRDQPNYVTEKKVSRK